VLLRVNFTVRSWGVVQEEQVDLPPQKDVSTP
jgi:hypothetical protein